MSHRRLIGSKLIFICGFAVIGVILLSISHAGTPTVSIEPENGTLSNPNMSVNNGTASNGKAIKFSSGAAQPATGSLIKTNCSPAAAATDGTMVWNSADENNVFDVYIGNGSCVGSALLPAYDGNRGAADITSDGRYVLLVTAVGWDKNISWAQPGKGSGNAIQLYDRQTNRLSTLLAGAAADQRGVIWPRFNDNGTKIVWSQMVQTSFEMGPIGSWQLHVASVNLATGTLSNNITWQDPTDTSALYEPYGWIPNTNKIIYMSSANETATDTTAMQLYTLPDTLPVSQHGTRLSPQISPYWPWETPIHVYHEFVDFAPGDSNTFYTSIGVAALGADLWKYDLRTAGSDGLLGQPTRVSYFGGNYRAPLGQQAVAGWPAPQYSIVGGMAWVNSGWVAGVCGSDSCATINAYRINP